MIILQYFVIAFVISALGTIPVGLITLTIAQKTIAEGKVAGWQVALGASIMEFVYTLIALFGLEMLSLESKWKWYVQIVTIGLFFLLGIYYWFKSPTALKQASSKLKQKNFIQGIGIGMMNLLIVPFWLVVGLWLESNGITFENTSCILWFSVGATLGALLIFVAYIEGSVFLLNKSEKVTSYANKIIGGLFLVLALIQFLQVV